MIGKQTIDKEELYFKISQKYDLSINDVRNIIESQFKGVATGIKNDKEVMLPYFGKFVKHKSKKL
jgi:nucleoid DNA-binding protein